MVDFLITIAICFVVASVIAIGWASGIHNMHKEHPNYKGDDFLDLYKDTEDNETR